MISGDAVSTGEEWIVRSVAGIFCCASGDMYEGDGGVSVEIRKDSADRCDRKSGDPGAGVPGSGRRTGETMMSEELVP